MDFIISTADYKRRWALTDDRIAGIKNLYKKGSYTADTARDHLGRLDLPAEQITVLMEQWFYEVKEEVPKTWTTAQTIAFAKAGLITRARAIRELRLIGYDIEHIDVYAKGIE